MGKDISRIVNRYIKKYETRDPFEIAERMGIEYLIGDLGSRWGCYMYMKRHRCIFINENLSENDMKQVMAHELGHAILHRKQNCYFIQNKTLFLNSKTEKEANQFAADLLIGDDILIEAKEKGFTERQLARLVGCHEKLIELKLHDQNKLQKEGIIHGISGSS